GFRRGEGAGRGRREIPASINPSRSRPRASGCAGLRASRPEFTTWVPREINLHDVMNVPYSEPSSTQADGEDPPEKEGRVMMRGFRLSLAVLATFLVTLSLTPAYAQTASAGALVGTVTDASGAAIPGAKLELKNGATNLVQSQGSNATGAYTFSGVAPGTYTLTVSAPGFQSRVITGLAIEVNKSFTINPRLAVGQQSQTVEVTADSQVELQTVDAPVGNVVDEASIDHLPTVQHDTVKLLGLQPATLGSGSATRVNGAIDDQNTIKLDGVDIRGTSWPAPSPR